MQVYIFWVTCCFLLGHVWQCPPKWWISIGIYLFLNSSSSSDIVGGILKQWIYSVHDYPNYEYSSFDRYWYAHVYQNFNYQIRPFRWKIWRCPWKMEGAKVPFTLNSHQLCHCGPTRTAVRTLLKKEKRTAGEETASTGRLIRNAHVQEHDK